MVFLCYHMIVGMHKEGRETIDLFALLFPPSSRIPSHQLADHSRDQKAQFDRIMTTGR